MENILFKIFKPFISSLLPRQFNIIPALPAGIAALAGGAGAAGAAGGASALGTAALGASGAAGLAAGGGAAGGAGGTLGAFGGSGGGGGGIPIAMGIAQGIGALRAGRRAKALEPPREDIEQRRFLNEIQRQRRALRTGVAFRQTQRELGQQQALAARGALRTGRGDLLARLTRQTQGALGEAAAREEQRGVQLTQMAGDLLERISQRRLDLARTQQAKEEARAAGLRREAFGNVLGAVGAGANVGQAPTGGGITEETAERIRQLLGGSGTQQ